MSLSQSLLPNLEHPNPHPVNHHTSRCLNAELCATPVATLAVVFDFRVRLQPEPRGKGLVLFVLYTQGALGPETFLTRHS